MRDESDVTFTENIHERRRRRFVGHDREIVSERVEVRLPPDFTGVGQQGSGDADEVFDHPAIVGDIRWHLAGDRSLLQNEHPI